MARSSLLAFNNINRIWWISTCYGIQIRENNHQYGNWDETKLSYQLSEFYTALKSDKRKKKDLKSWLFLRCQPGEKEEWLKWKERFFLISFQEGCTFPSRAGLKLCPKDVHTDNSFKAFFFLEVEHWLLSARPQCSIWPLIVLVKLVKNP